jgi:replication initiation and membrane attachment protein
MQSFQYKITVKKKINDDDKKVLLNLYQPIIGPQATTTYLVLLEEQEVLAKVTKLEFNDSRLLNITQLNQADLEAVFIKLEGIKLLKRSYNKARGMMNFQILKPSEPNDFFANVVLSDMLENKLGPDNFEIRRYLYLDDENFDEEFEDLSVSFEQAFPDESQRIRLAGYNQVNPLARKHNAEEYIDFDNLMLLLIQREIPGAALTKSVRKLLVENVRFFNLAESLELEDLANIIMKAYRPELQAIEKDLLNLYLKEAINESLADEKAQEVERLKGDFYNFSPSDYVANLTGNKANYNIQLMINRLETEFHFKDEIINCLINYSVLKSNRISDRYILKISQTLDQKHITSLDEVMEHLRTAHHYSGTKETKVVRGINHVAHNHNLKQPEHAENKDFELPEAGKYFNI